MGKTINNYPKKPHFIVDVTRPANGCGGCTKYAMKSNIAQQGSWRTSDGSAWWLRDAKYNEPNGDYHANCYLHIYDVNPNNVRFNDGNCNYASGDYLCQPIQQLKCGPGSSGSCKLTRLSTPGYSAGNVIRVTNGRRVRKSVEKHSCPKGYKIWSPRNKNDWTIVFNAMKKNINNYPKKPHLIVDVTRPANGCGGCTKYAMKSGVGQQGSWRTTDGSAWWLRDAKYNEPNGDYHANCCLHVYDVNPNNVRFNDGSCAYSTTDYLCQKSAKKTPSKGCRKGSAGNCKVTNVPVKGYSAGQLVKISNGLRVRKSTEKNSCPDGFKIWSPRNKNDWTIVYNAMGKNINNYPKKPHFIVDVTRPANGCGGCTKYAMRSNIAQQGSWKTKDGSAWWLRDARYNEPNGDYHANCYLHIYDVNPNNVCFNDGNCNYYSTEYMCQKALKGYKCAPGSPS